MNCPNCGAENEAGARFCVECGAPLESQVEIPINPPEFDDADDRTILSSMSSRIAEEAKTMAVTQEQLAEAEAASSSSWQSSAGSTSSPASGGTGGLQGMMTQRNIIIAVVVIILLCCCCCALGVAGSIASDPDSFEDLMRELTSLPLHLGLV